jgi:hypothetical protein
MIEDDVVSFEEEDFGGDDVANDNITSIDEARRGMVDDFVRFYFESLVREEVPEDVVSAVAGLR